LRADWSSTAPGPHTSFSSAAEQLFKNLLERSLVRVDGLDTGIEVDANFATVERDGRRSAILYALGPLLKGTLWETTAVPELRGPGDASRSDSTSGSSSDADVACRIYADICGRGRIFHLTTAKDIDSVLRTPESDQGLGIRT